MATRAERKAKAGAARIRAVSDDPKLVERREYMRVYFASASPETRARWRRNQAASHLRLKYGITLEQRDALLASQGGCCVLCRKEIEFTGRADKKSAHLDHDHVTGRIRGVLCAQCNTALGKLGDTAESLERAVRYLRGELQ